MKPVLSGTASNRIVRWAKTSFLGMTSKAAQLVAGAMGERFKIVWADVHDANVLAADRTGSGITGAEELS